MSDLLTDSPNAVKIRDRILGELRPNEQVLFATDALVHEPRGGSQFYLYTGVAIIVTSERLLLAEPKMMGRASFVSVPWTDVENGGRTNDGDVVVQRKVKGFGSWPIWEIQIWEGKNHRSPRDQTRLNILSMCIRDAWQAVKSADAVVEAADTAAAYEELKKRRGF